jgi:hypothetical protein
MKTLNLTREELIELVNLVHDGIMHRQNPTGFDSMHMNQMEMFLLNYARMQAGYPFDNIPELQERLKMTDTNNA